MLRRKARGGVDPREPGWDRTDDRGAAALILAPAVGMAETFHDLLTLDSSVLNRGRDSRQHELSAQLAHEDEPICSAKPYASPRPVCAERLLPSESAECPGAIKERSRKSGKFVWTRVSDQIRPTAGQTRLERRDIRLGWSIPTVQADLRSPYLLFSEQLRKRQE